MKWEFTPDEFIHLWQETGQDRYPPPLRLRSSTRWRDDHAQLTATLNTRFPKGADPDLTAALRVSSNPDTTLTLTGIRNHPLRAYAALTNGVAVTLVQRPSPRPEIGGNMIIEAGAPPLIPSVFTAVMGAAQPGTIQPAVTPSPSTPKPTHVTPTRRSITDTRTPDLARILRLAHTRPSARGDIAVHRNLRTDHPAPPRYLHWFDIANDGRYTVEHRKGELRISPCSPDTLREHIIQLLGLRG
ncbi:ESX secretion-associated protein EspG [Nocardia yamanashiensis]|uniref:ESX secretion-associated protein EspG n=1 Tax=Nocardia yamanashiensis TaxID=209247 RepID=UPI001E582A4F|nr:ESX secretion-associated protein EspG [Nocardia yamanashiensis]UGT45076.1 ESX secretion-associated protein EspG [Nocardia yamanashiensis]